MASVATVVAIVTGIIFLAGYFLDIPVLVAARQALAQWAMLLASVALLVGLANLVQVHWRRMVTSGPNASYSAVLLVSMLLTLGVVAAFGLSGTWSLWLFRHVQVPVESSLMALLAIVLIYAGARVLNRRINLFAAVFIGTALLVLLGSATIPGADFPVLNQLRGWIERVPAAAGARGILFGVALGTIATGLRVLIGAERPYIH
jgi:hypothetical protein